MTAILDAAWDQLVECGYPGFTFEAVAQRAQTSRPVLYRRWPGRAELLRATIAHHGAQQDFHTPDTGTLRGDLLAALRRANHDRADFLVLLSASLGEYYSETGSSPRDVRALLVTNRARMVDEILARAASRGEVDLDRLTPRVRGVAFDLYRQEVLMTLKPVGDEVLVEIVDDIVLPLLDARSRPPGNLHPNPDIGITR